MKNKKVTLTVGIAAYNEEQSIAHIVSDIMAQRRDNFELKQILILSDGSTDKTVQIVRKLQKKNKLIKLVADRKNHGKQYRLNQMYKMNTSDILVNFDADIGLVGDRILLKGVQKLIDDPNANLVAIHQHPLRPKNLFGKVLHASFIVWDEVRLSIPEHKSIHLFYGAASLYRRSLVKRLHIPEGCKDERAYQYLMAKQTDGFRYIADERIIYWPPMTYKDWLSMTRRAFGKRSLILEKMFGTDISKEYVVPRKYILIGTAKAFFKNPLYTPPALVLNFLMSVISKRVKPPETGRWEIVSSKYALPE